MAQQFCEESLDFMEAVDTYEAMPEDDEAKREAKIKFARAVYNIFVSPKGEKQVNVDFNTNQATEKSVQALEAGLFLLAHI